MSDPYLRAVDELCRLAMTARRLGCRVHLSGAGDGLRELLELAGVSDVLIDCPADADADGDAGGDDCDLR